MTCAACSCSLGCADVPTLRHSSLHATQASSRPCTACLAARPATACMCADPRWAGQASSVFLCDGHVMESASVWLGIAGLLVIAVLMSRSFRGSVFIGMLFVTVVAWIPGTSASYLGSGSQIAGKPPASLSSRLASPLRLCLPGWPACKACGTAPDSVTLTGASCMQAPWAVHCTLLLWELPLKHLCSAACAQGACDAPQLHASHATPLCRHLSSGPAWCMPSCDADSGPGEGTTAAAQVLRLTQPLPSEYTACRAPTLVTTLSCALPQAVKGA